MLMVIEVEYVCVPYFQMPTKAVSKVKGTETMCCSGKKPLAIKGS